MNQFKLIAFLRLVRWQNLVFILITQVMFEYCIYFRVYPGFWGLDNESRQFWLIVAASVLIAAGGYIINDYFDLNIDQVNKPKKVVVNNFINRRWVILWHLILSIAGLAATIAALPFRSYFHLIFANLLCIIILVFYSTTLKKKLLIGNLLISVLTAWVIGIIFFSKYHFGEIFTKEKELSDARYFRFTIIYCGFAFIVSLIREVIKDMEDVEGDIKYGCRTMPIVWGINASKVFVAVWLIVLISTITILQFYVLQFGWWLSVLYSLLAILFPLIIIFRKLFKAQTALDFNEISKLIKIVMLTGIVSMIFFRLY